MFNTMRFDDVQQTLDHLRHSMDQLFGKFAGDSNGHNETREWSFSPVIETGWDEDALHIRAIVPGVDESDLKVTIQNGQLVIEGERKAPTTMRDGFRQLAYGNFASALNLPSGVNTEQVKCHLDKGILEITMPVTESVKPRQIPIGSGSQQKAIGA